MTIFIMGFIIFCCGMIYRYSLSIEKTTDNKIYSETKTITGGIE